MDKLNMTKLDSFENKPSLENEFKHEEDRATELEFRIDQELSKELSECPVCKRKFQSRSGLDHHTSSIHEGKTYNCGVCSSNFTSKGNLKMHIRIVHERKTFKNFRQR